VEKLIKKHKSLKIIFIYINKQIKTWENNFKIKIYGHNAIKIHLNIYSKLPKTWEFFIFFLETLIIFYTLPGTDRPGLFYDVFDKNFQNIMLFLSNTS
jgi:hypothetical protein